MHDVRQNPGHASITSLPRAVQLCSHACPLGAPYRSLMCEANSIKATMVLLHQHDAGASWPARTILGGPTFAAGQEIPTDTLHIRVS